MKKHTRKILLITVVMGIALCALIVIISYSRNSAETHSEATEYSNK
ncbi:MAG: hypothetical protein WC043_02480 [Pseudobdellovibrionaceae bacterium]